MKNYQLIEKRCQNCRLFKKLGYPAAPRFDLGTCEHEDGYSHEVSIAGVCDNHVKKEGERSTGDENQNQSSKMAGHEGLP